MHIQLMRSGEASVDDAHTAINRWREYVDSYVTEHPTEWVQGIGVGMGQPRLFVRRRVFFFRSDRGTRVLKIYS